MAREILPGVNCGACGFAGCAAYASALVEGNAPVNLCKPGGSDVANKLAELLCIQETEPVTPKVARVFCSGGIDETVKDKVYVGVKNCAAAHLVGGEKACLYSCLGYGDCVEACPFDAIHMNKNGLPVVDLSKCTGCSACVEACPRNIIGLTEVGEAVHVYCRSHDKGTVVRNICTAGCTVCKICEMDDDTGAVKVIDNLAVIDYGINKAPVESVKRCPTKAIRVSEPVPGYNKQFNERTRVGELQGVY
jgi:Na+-translocating ferredoxin:NAD+ oxidoreductase RNF subunit RnfB